jgi:hypothetical protein
MWRKLINIWKPDIYHGLNKEGSYFEGWYFKMVEPQNKKAFAFIPGIYKDRDKKKSHAFIQFLDSKSHQTSYFRYSINQFQSQKNNFDIQIGDSQFKRNYIDININSDGRIIKGNLEFSDQIPWPVSLFSPGVMGRYAFAPFMECYHGILSFDHQILGKLSMDGQTVDFSGGRGYIEKDWGISFPRAYIWMQSNHFKEPGTSLFVSVARIPWCGGAFRGLIAGFLFQGRLYRLTTYTKAKIKKIAISDTDIHIIITDRLHQLEVKAQRTEGGVLFGPDGQDFFQHISESLQSRLSVTFIRDGKTIFKGDGHPAGLELNGKLEEIVF